jgi:hypothetical protein
MKFQIHTAAAARWPLIIALIVGLLTIPLVIGILYLVSKPSAQSRVTNCEPATSWSAWSDCSVPCASGGVGGWQYRTRPPSVMPTNGGTECAVTDLVQSQSCNTDVPCGLPCVPDPDPDKYAWSGCPACLPSGSTEAFQWRIVPPLQEPGPYGAPCPTGTVFQTSLCTDLAPCPANIDCTISTTTVMASTTCNAPCGTGVQILWHSVSQPPSGRGAGCDWNLFVEQVPCTSPNGPCPTTLACNSNAYTWSAWSQCDVTCGEGWQYATRDATGPFDHCPLVKSQTCAGLLPTCSGNTTHGCCIADATCATPTWEYLESLCYMQCAGMPLPATPPSDNGLPFCSVTQDMLDAACGAGALPGQGACIEPRDCQLTTWSAWSPCSVPYCNAAAEQGGVQVATRSITAYAVGGGVPCSDFPTTLYRPCNNIQSVPYMSLSAASDQVLVPATMAPQCVPQDCVLSDWYAVGPCSTQCGDGWQMLAKSITSPPQQGGTCDLNVGDFVSSQTCNLGACGGCVFMSLDDYLAQCEVEGRNPWSTCSAQCDGEKTLSLPIATPAPPGGWCSYTDSLRVAPCCEGCVCEAACPMGVNGVPCSNNGTCVSVSSTVSGATSWTYSCKCNGNYSGLACGVQCPIGLDGSACGAASGLGVCGDNGECTCSSGLSGPACNVGGYCLASGTFVQVDGSARGFTMSVPLMSTASDAIDQGSCNAYAQAMGKLMSGSGFLPVTNVWSSLTIVPPPSSGDVGVIHADVVTSMNTYLEQLYGPTGVYPGIYATVPQLASDQAAHTVAWPGSNCISCWSAAQNV